jgi:excisionase family DNA binding protein
MTLVDRERDGERVAPKLPAKTFQAAVADSISNEGRRSLMPSLPPVDASSQLELNFEAQPASCRASSYEALLTIAEASATFNVPRHALRRSIKSGAIPAYRFGNGRLRLRASDIERAIEASRTGGAR